jgi:hypothetical protein
VRGETRPTNGEGGVEHTLAASSLRLAARRSPRPSAAATRGRFGARSASWAGAQGVSSMVAPGFSPRAWQRPGTVPHKDQPEHTGGERSATSEAPVDAF